MFFRADINACDSCGLCCRASPCLLADVNDIKALSKELKLSLRETCAKYLQMERLPNNSGWQVRMRRGTDGACIALKDNKCSVHKAKPQGGRDYKCWDKNTFSKTYIWPTLNDIALKLNVSAPRN